MDEKTLIVGNDAQTEALLSQVLSGSDFQVLIISGNGSSVSPSALIGPDLIIFDSLLPGAPGSRLSKMIRSGPMRADGDTELPFPEMINTWKSLPDKTWLSSASVCASLPTIRVFSSMVHPCQRC